MEDLLKEETYSFVSPRDKKFIIAFDAEMDRLGYTSNQTIGDGYCWGRKMIIYTKAGVKSKKSYARIYLRENDLIGGMKDGEPSADGRGSAPPELAEQQARAGSEAAPATPPL